MHDEYYERVATFLAMMKDGESFYIDKKVKHENREKFIDCFRRFAGVTINGPYWWDWDDEKGIITKHKYPPSWKPS